MHCRLLILGLMVSICTGCASLPDPKEATFNPAKGIVINATREQAFDIARTAMIQRGITPETGSPELGYLAGDHSWSAFSWGELVGVYMREVSPNQQQVWVISKPKMLTNVFAPNWTGPILTSIRYQLDDSGAPRPESVAEKSMPKKSVATGTGFVVRPDGYIITAQHVIQGKQRIQVRIGSTKNWIDAVVEKSNSQNDIALLKITNPTPDYLDLVPASEIRLGQKVFTLGFPVPGFLGDEMKYTDGAVSSLSVAGEDAVIQMSVPIQPGNSGGPVLNEKGQVVGMVTSSAAVVAFLRSTATLPQNVNFAVKSSYIMPLLASVTTQARTFADPVSHAQKCIVQIMAE